VSETRSAKRYPAINPISRNAARCSLTASLAKRRSHAAMMDCGVWPRTARMNGMENFST
jgi:hypothetical protein